MPAAVVFISHIHEERDLAALLKRHVVKWFGDSVDVFVSTDIDDVAAGENWLETMDQALHRASLTVLCCSPVSVRRPWIHFEAGAAWMRRIPIIPLCHTGLEPRLLPMPLGILQAVRGSDAGGMEALFRAIAKNANATVPGAPFGAIGKDVGRFEERYLSEIPPAVRTEANGEAALLATERRPKV